MDRLTFLDAGLRALDTRLPDVTPSLCVVTRYRGSSCRRCLDACPGSAITCVDWLAVAPDLCSSCGACAAVCRTGALAFVGRSAALRDCLAAAVAEGQAGVALVCRPAKPAYTVAGATLRAVAVPCLGGVGAADLVAAAVLGNAAVELVAGRCGLPASGGRRLRRRRARGRSGDARHARRGRHVLAPGGRRRGRPRRPRRGRRGRRRRRDVATGALLVPGLPLRSTVAEATTRNGTPSRSCTAKRLRRPPTRGCSTTSPPCARLRPRRRHPACRAAARGARGRRRLRRLWPVCTLLPARGPDDRRRTRSVECRDRHRRRLCAEVCPPGALAWGRPSRGGPILTYPSSPDPDGSSRAGPNPMRIRAVRLSVCAKRRRAGGGHMGKLTVEQRDEALQRLSDWQEQGEAISRTFHLRTSRGPSTPRSRSPRWPRTSLTTPISTSATTRCTIALRHTASAVGRAATSSSRRGSTISPPRRRGEETGKAPGPPPLAR